MTLTPQEITRWDERVNFSLEYTLQRAAESREGGQGLLGGAAFISGLPASFNFALRASRFFFKNGWLREVKIKQRFQRDIGTKRNSADPFRIAEGLTWPESFLRAVAIVFLVKTQYETSASRALSLVKRPVGRSVNSNLLFL
jgi:hypothetical protein